MTACPGADCAHEPLSEDGIARLVDRFYEKVRQDEDLAPVFAGKIADEDWPAHLATMRDFWSSIMLTSGRYHGNPVAAHRRTPGITPDLFERWLGLFAETAAELFDEAVAEAFKDKAGRIATSLRLAMFYKPEQDRPIGRRMEPPRGPAKSRPATRRSP